MEGKHRNIIFNIIILVLALSGIISIYGLSNLNKEIKEKSNLIESLEAEMITWKDKDSLNHAKIQVIETQSLKDFLNIKSKDSTITELQSLVKDYKKQLSNKGSATIIKGETVYEETKPTKPEYIEKIPTGGIFDTISNPYIYGVFGFTPTETIFKLKVINDYTVIIGEESQGWFKPKKPFVEVTNKNPYSTTTTLRTYQVATPKVKKIGIGPTVGYGFGENFKGQPFIGIGLQYNLIRL